MESERKRPILERAIETLDIEAEAILDLKDRLGENFIKVVETLRDCQGRIVVTGMGKSGLIGKKIASTLASIGVPALFMHAAEGVHGDIGMVARGDVVIAISNSGETEEILKLLGVIKRFGVVLVAMTGQPHSTLARHADLILDVSVKEEACPLDLVPTASSTAALALGDAIAMALLEAKGLREDDFAVYHPGGILGRRLLLKVSDLMHSGEELPVIPKESAIRDVIFEMTKKRLGMTCVVNGDGSLAGIITDGDLRRAIERAENIYETKAEDAMTPSPRVIEEEALAAYALQVMETHKITSLIIPDSQGRPKGVIHLHDILQAGVV
ncbi:MAG: SIS domain-containing protein [Nitrospinota bacterium]